ncbi:MAG TPA: SPOR domain-containing protein [Methyloceanibacter sp.]|nr:SPOR domain-containing protein [Methyloceanibacter sp.]
MPSYTPVTRAPEASQPAPEPAYAPYPANQPAAAPQQPAAPQAAPRNHQPQAPQHQPAPAYQPHQPRQPQQPQHQPQAFGGNQPYQPQAYPAAAPAPSYPQTGYANGQQGDPRQEMPDLSNADPGFPDSIFPDFSNAGANFADHDDGGADQGGTDASFSEQGGDADFPEPNYQSSPDFSYDEAPSQAEPQFEPAADVTPDFRMAAAAPAMPQAPRQSYAPQQSHAGQPQAPHGGDPRRQLQAFDAVYDQPPQIALGGSHAPSPAPAPAEFYETDRSDADFLDESQALPPPAARSKLGGLKGRSAFMVGSALLGAIALGGAMAYAYKQSGGGMGSEQPPIVQADARPVKAAPDDPGGKEFPNKNKLIYDRLTNGDVAEGERIVPRQEDVAVPALPPATDTAGLPASVATTDLANPATTQGVETAEDGGPRKVKTLVVRPDGSVEAPAAAEVAEAAGAAADAATAAVDTATTAATGAVPGSVMPVPAAQALVPPAAAPAPAAAPQQLAAVEPAPAPAAPTKYVVQVGAHKSQTDALANYADIQQKNASLLGKFPPMVQKVAVSGGTMYRLRVGPMDSKAKAYKLCGDLKASGTDCFVATQ